MKQREGLADPSPVVLAHAGTQRLSSQSLDSRLRGNDIKDPKLVCGL